MITLPSFQTVRENFSTGISKIKEVKITSLPSRVSTVASKALSLVKEVFQATMKTCSLLALRMTSKLGLALKAVVKKIKACLKNAFPTFFQKEKKTGLEKPRFALQDEAILDETSWEIITHDSLEEQSESDLRIEREGEQKDFSVFPSWIPVGWIPEGHIPAEMLQIVPYVSPEERIQRGLNNGSLEVSHDEETDLPPLDHDFFEPAEALEPTEPQQEANLAEEARAAPEPRNRKKERRKREKHPIRASEVRQLRHEAYCFVNGIR